MKSSRSFSLGGVNLLLHRDGGGGGGGGCQMNSGYLPTLRERLPCVFKVTAEIDHIIVSRS